MHRGAESELFHDVSETPGDKEITGVRISGNSCKQAGYLSGDLEEYVLNRNDAETGRWIYYGNRNTKYLFGVYGGRRGYANSIFHGRGAV